MKVCAFATPDNIRSGDLEGTAAVVIDALRMTSVAATAFANGCAGLRACAEVEAARAEAARCGGLLGGERNALRIEGFDFSNSPAEYAAEKVTGRRLVMTTSNGTRAIAACAGAKRLLLGAFVNAAAVARRLHGEEKVALVCAGTLGAFTLEDALAAGCILTCLHQTDSKLETDDMALACRTLYEGAKGDLFAALAATKHFNRLKLLGLEADLRFCLTENTLSAVGEQASDGWFYCKFAN